MWSEQPTTQLARRPFAPAHNSRVAHSILIHPNLLGDLIFAWPLFALNQSFGNVTSWNQHLNRPLNQTFSNRKRKSRGRGSTRPTANSRANVHLLTEGCEVKVCGSLWKLRSYSRRVTQCSWTPVIFSDFTLANKRWTLLGFKRCLFSWPSAYRGGGRYVVSYDN